MINKFVILGDVHIGVRNSNVQVMEHQLQYYETQLFPYLEENNIDIIVQLGDLFDHRKFQNHFVIHEWKKRFFDYLLKKDITLITLLGNHDIFYKNTLDVNSTSLLLGEYSNIAIVDKPQDITIYGTNFSIIPWICESNREQIEKFVEETESIFCFGHFEFAGFEINKGFLATNGDDPSLYEKFDIVFSGHYHTQGVDKNIFYVGTPCEYTWIDYNDPKGFHVFDVVNQDVEFIQNNKPLFVKYFYDDQGEDDSYIDTFDISLAKNSYVKVVVSHKENIYQLDKLVNKLLQQEPIDLKVIDEIDNFDDIEIDENDVEFKDTFDLIKVFIDQLDTDLDRTRIETMMKQLYVESLEII